MHPLQLPSSWTACQTSYVTAKMHNYLRYITNMLPSTHQISNRKGAVTPEFLFQHSSESIMDCLKSATPCGATKLCRTTKPVMSLAPATREFHTKPSNMSLGMPRHDLLGRVPHGVGVCPLHHLPCNCFADLHDATWLSICLPFMSGEQGQLLKFNTRLALCAWQDNWC